MKGIVELILAISVLLGGSRYAANYLLQGMKKNVAEKIQIQGRSSLGNMTRALTKTK